MAQDQGTYRSTLLVHLDSLYSVAQMLARDSDEAARLVEATYQRAFATAVDEPSLQENGKTWLLQLLMQVREEQAHLAPEGPPVQITAEEHGEEEAPSDTFRQRLADQLVDRLLPLALAAIPDDRRLLLVLCEVEGLSCIDAGAVVGLPADQACAQAAETRERLTVEVYSVATPAERHLLESGLADDWLHDGLERLTNVERAPLPASLRANITAAARQASLKKEIPSQKGEPEDHRQFPFRLFSRAESRRLAFPLLLIFTAGLLGIALSWLFREEPERNLITLSADQAEDVDVMFRTRRPVEAERFVLERLKWRLRVPEIDEAVFRGVSIQEVTRGVRVPVFVYDDTSIQQPVVVYTYNYALLDRYADRLMVDSNVLDQIRDDGSFDLYDIGDDKVLIWRSRDEIYVGVTHGDAEDLRERIAIAQ